MWSYISKNNLKKNELKCSYRFGMSDLSFDLNSFTDLICLSSLLGELNIDCKRYDGMRVYRRGIVWC